MASERAASRQVRVFYKQRLDQRFVLVAGDLHDEIEGLSVLLCDEFLLDGGDGVIRQPLLGIFGGTQDARLGGRRLPQVDAVFALERIADVVQQQLVEIVAAQLGVAVTGHDLDHAVFDLRDRDVKRAAAQVVDEQPFELGGMRVVGEYGGRRLVDDANDFEPGELARFAGGLSLAVVEECRDGDDDLSNCVAQALLGAILELLEDDRRDFLGRECLAAQVDGDFLAHLPLDRADGAFRRQNVLVGAAAPTSSWPPWSRPTTEGRIASPFSSRTTARPSLMTATSLLVVPRSMPMIVCVHAGHPSPWLCVLGGASSERDSCPQAGPDLALLGESSSVSRLHFRKPQNAAAPRIASPQFFGHRSRGLAARVDDFEHGHELGIDRAALAQGSARSARPPSVCWSRFWISPNPSANESK